MIIWCLTHVLLNMTCPVLANSVDPEEANWSGSALFVIKYVNFYQKPDWLEIRSGSGILIYSAWQGLKFNSIEVISRLFAQAFLSEYLG